MARKTSRTSKEQLETDTPGSYLDRVSSEIESNQSRLTMILGGLIILVVVVLVFNYFNRSEPSLGPSQQTEEETVDVAPSKLPGKYMVKEGDTLFSISEKYYQDGYKYTEIAQANNLSDPNNIEVGQELEIPKLAVETLSAASTSQPEATPRETLQATPEITSETTTKPQDQGMVEPMQNWGTPITGNTYTVLAGDWLSTIAARAYNGDIMGYTKIAQANNISNPDLIFPGQVLSIPR